MKEHEELGNVKSNILARLDEIRTELNSLNLRNKKKIGQDYKKNDYFVKKKIFTFKEFIHLKIFYLTNLIYLGFRKNSEPLICLCKKSKFQTWLGMH